MDNEKRNGNTALLTVIGVSTLLVALVGATFAFFTATANNSDAQSVIVKTAAPMSLVYESEGTITLLNAQPGDKSVAVAGEKNTFTVHNPSTTEASSAGKEAIDLQYSMALVVVENGFTTTPTVAANQTKSAKQLVLTLKGSTDGTSSLQINSTGTELNMTDGDTAWKAGTSHDLITDQPIKAGETHTYTGDLEFLENDENQDENQNKSFAAHIDITDISTFVG